MWYPVGLFNHSLSRENGEKNVRHLWKRKRLHRLDDSEKHGQPNGAILKGNLSTPLFKISYWLFTIYRIKFWYPSPTHKALLVSDFGNNSRTIHIYGPAGLSPTSISWEAEETKHDVSLEKMDHGKVSVWILKYRGKLEVQTQLKRNSENSLKDKATDFEMEMISECWC